MNNKYLSIALILVMAMSIVGIATAYSGTADVVVENVENWFSGAPDLSEESSELTLGGTTKGDWNVKGDTNLQDLVQGGGSLAVSATTTLTAAQVCDNSVIEHNPTQAAVNLTLPATSTLFADCLDDVGDMKTILLYNSADAAENITVVAGTGVDLQEPDGQNVVIGQNNYAMLTFVRLSDTTGEVMVMVDETIPAD